MARYFCLERFETGMPRSNLIIWEEVGGLPEVLDMLMAEDEDDLIRVLEEPRYTDLVQRESFPWT